MTMTAGTARRLRRMLDGLLVVLILVVFGGVVLGKIVPAFGATTLVVAGPSMGEKAPIGAAVVAVPVPPGDLAVGDIVSMRIGPQHAVFTHRIVRTVFREGGVWLETKGDANADADPSLVPATAVIGRVQVIVPLAGYLIALLSTASGVAFLLGLGAVLIAMAWILEPIELDGEDADQARPQGAEGPIEGPSGFPLATR